MRYKERFRRIEFTKKILKVQEKELKPDSTYISISATVLGNGDMMLETTSVLQHFWPFFLFKIG